MHKRRHLGFLASTLLILFWLGLSQAQKDCTGVDCEPLENCIEEVLESDACCASCLQRGCTCEGYQYYDCVNVGFRHGKVPEGQSYFVDFGSTECSCPKGGGKISCQFIACHELPANCIEVLQPADGCPQCGSLGCVQGDQKYVEGHTFQMPGCKVCHCPKYGGELMCYPMPDCDASTLNPQVKTEHEDSEAARHYDDPYSYDQDAPDRDSARLETSKRHRSSLTSTSVETSMEQDKDYDQSEKSIPFPKFLQPALPDHGSNISNSNNPSTPSYFSEEDMNDLTTTEVSEIEDVSESTTLANSAYEKAENIISTTQESVVPDTTPEHDQEEKEDKATLNDDDPRQEDDNGKDNSMPATTEMPTLPPQSKQDHSKEDHEEHPLPSVRFSPTAIPAIALKDHSEVAERQSQTLYHYARDEDNDSNSISLGSRLQEGSTKEIIETCCAAGQQWAVDNGECVDIPLSDTDSAACRIAQTHCCVSYLKENSCVAGMIAAKEGDFCVTDETDTCGGSFYKQCCDCCNMGLKVKSEGQTCESNPNLGYPCNQVMLSCCEGEDQLMPPEIKKQPEPEPTAKPEKVSEPLAHNEAYSVDNQDDTTDLLPGDDVDECLLYPGQLCRHLCINTVGSYKCDCFPGFTLQEDGSSCKPDNENFDENSVLLQQTTAPELLQENSLELVTVAAPRVQEDKCKDNGPCKHMCNIVEDKVVCSCSPGYTLMVDGVSCEDINECVAEAHTCLRGERCINTEGSFTCLKEVICQAGYENKDDICVDIDECERGTHDCKVGFTCQNSKGAFYCESKQRCRDGFIQDPAGNCVDVNECTSLPEPCKVGFNCINTVGSYTCQRNQLMCSRGYHASDDGTRCVDVDECQTGVHRCGEGQVCHNLPGTYHCDCKRGYQADSFSRTCIDINECWNYPGQLCQHTCENTPGSYRCSCSSGFRLAFDGKHCEDINECENNPCSQECANVYGSYQCYCRQGYQLAEDGHSCKDIDECVQSIGTLCTFRCVNVPGSYQCACPDQGYTIAANGRTCKDIDECSIGSHNCSSSDSCFNIQGSYRCQSFMCPENYRKVADMRCERINCLNYLDCQNTPVRITYYQLTFPSNIVVPSHIFRIGPSPAYAGDNIVLTITKGNEENYFSTRKLNQYTGIVFIQRQIKEPKDFLLDVEMKLWRQGTYTTFLARMYVFITEQAM